jgi:hypothetical protein
MEHTQYQKGCYMAPKCPVVLKKIYNKTQNHLLYKKKSKKTVIAHNGSLLKEIERSQLISRYWPGLAHKCELEEKLGSIKLV